jgi:hypothetical protein
MLVRMYGERDPSFSVGTNVNSCNYYGNQNAMPLLGIYLKECHSIYKRDTCIPMFIAALVTIAELCYQLRCPTTNKWVKKI